MHVRVWLHKTKAFVSGGTHDKFFFSAYKNRYDHGRTGRSGCYGPVIASFPGSPHARMKNRKERGELGKIYHVRNVIGRENLITCGRTNELAHAVWTDIVVQL